MDFDSHHVPAATNEKGVPYSRPTTGTRMPTQKRFRTRPAWACLEPCPVLTNFAFCCGQQPEPQIDYWMISGLFFYRRIRLNQTASGKASFSGGQPSQKRLQNEGRITRFSRDFPSPNARGRVSHVIVSLTGFKSCHFYPRSKMPVLLTVIVISWFIAPGRRGGITPQMRVRVRAMKL